MSAYGQALTADPALARAWCARGWWSDETLQARIDALAAERPNEAAYITPRGRFTWADYARQAAEVAAALASLGLDPGDRVAVLLPDGPMIHAVFVGLAKAGLVTVGIGARAGDQEIAHLVRRTGARALVTHATLRERPTSALLTALAEREARIEHLVVVPDVLAEPQAPIQVDGLAVTDAAPPAGSGIGPDALFMINSTSGTTGLPKCVMHTQNRWRYFHQLAAEAGRFGAGEVFMGAVPAPFGFGLWTAHFSPAILGCPTVILERFDAHQALDLIERERVTVLCCVSTQFIMLLNAQAERPRDLSSLRCMFTGGEAVPYERAAEFEAVTGAAVLQFYGSNETGALSRTTAADTRDRRLRTAGQVIPEMEVRLFDPDTGADVTGTRNIGQPACRGPAVCLGYWDDAAANAKLFTPDGWMLMGDIVEIDETGYLKVVGRTSDFIIRGGKNLSAPAIEEEIAAHPGVALVAAAPAPDPVFGERVAVYVVARPGAEITLDGLTAHLAARGVSREWFPEYLVLMDDLPRSSGGKLAKGELREDARRRWGG
ncbi:MAG: acyl--CoA ligase [Caulobacterales bacterium]|nr:acyl--CoA ligase [Caulobacterales bacterium]